MKNTSIFASAAMILATAAIASANPFSDVPSSHWAYEAVNSMAEKGIIQGFPNGTFKGNQNVTRYQLAMITAKMIANVEQLGGSVSKTDLQTLEKLTVEFADELALLGVKVTALEDDMQVVKEDVAGLKKDVEALKNGGVGSVKLSGDMLVRNYGFKGEVAGTEDHRHHTETLLRLQMDAQVSENITARARWNVIENTNNNEWDGGNKGTGSVEVAYLQIHDMFGFGGDFKFGRDWYQHGHGFVVHNYMDAVSYAKRCGDIDLAFNLFFERQNDNDTHQIWNINADYNYKGHNLYLGVYYNTIMAQADADNEKKTVVEFGSHGKITKDNKVTYDVAGVYSSLKEADQKGWLGHVAVNYDSQKQLTAKVAYTFADDESVSAISSEQFNSYCCGDETIFDDLTLATMALNTNQNASSVLGGNRQFNNLNDLKIQLGYTLKNNNKHSFRLAYDMVQQKDEDKAVSGKPSTVKADLKANVITFDYQYKLAENTRIRFGYQNVKGEVKGCEDPKADLYFTEIYSRF